jgi:hypothetical protein
MDDGKVRSQSDQGPGDGSVLLSTGPKSMSFLYRYVMALFPIVLVIVCIFLLPILENMSHVASSSLTSAVAGTLGPYSTGIVNQYSSPVNDAASITVLMIAPVGIFIFFAAIGWVMRLTELWTSTALTLGLSGVAGIVMATWGGGPPVSGNYMLLLLQWIAYLVQPFCLVAAGIVIFRTEKFRRSIHYTITNEGLWIRGGFPGTQEHMIPHHQIGRIVFEQDYLGAMYNFGTLIPLSMTRWGEETSFRGIGATGQKDNLGVGIGYAKSREEGSRYPLDCLYGIPDPKKAQKIFTGFLARHETREEEQVSYLKKIYETNAAGTMADAPGTRPTVPTAAPGPGVKDDTGKKPVDAIAHGAKSSEHRESTIIRITGAEIPKTPAPPVTGTIREIPPTVKTEDVPDKGAPPADPIFDQIKKLSELRESGIITEQEFTAKKTELLKRI